MPKSTTDDASQLEVAATELLARLDGGEEARLVRKILELIEAIGVSGLTHSELCVRLRIGLATPFRHPELTVLSRLEQLLLPMSSRFSILATLSRLLESTSPDLSPLIFLTGFSHRPVYVSTVHLPSYAILLPSSSPTTKKRWLIPCIWTGIDGEINKEVWIRCLNFVKGILFKRSGLDFKQIEEISCTTVNGYHTPVLSSLELRIILETLDKNGILTRQSSTFESAVRNGEGAKEPGAKVPVDWETDRWSLKGVFWNA